MAWRRLAIALAVAVIGNVGMWSIVVLMPAIQTEFGADRAAATLPYTVLMIGFGLGNLVIGWLVDRYGLARALICSALCVGVGFVVSALSSGMALLVVAQGLVGFGTAATFGPLIADVSLWFLRRRGIAVSVAACGNYLSGAVWPVLLTGPMGALDWRESSLVLAVVVVALIVPLSVLLRGRVPETSLRRADAASSSRALLTGLSPRALIWLLGCAGIGCCVAMSMPQVHIVALCVDLGFGAVVGGQMLSLMLAGGVVSRLVSGLLADRLGGVRTLLLGSVLQCLALFLYLPAGGLVSLYTVSLVFGLAQGGIVPSYALVVREFLPAREAGQRVGFVMMLTIMGMALGGWMSGWIYDMTGDYQLAFVNGLVWNMLNIAIVVAIFWSARPGRPAQVAA